MGGNGLQMANGFGAVLFALSCQHTFSNGAMTAFPGPLGESWMETVLEQFKRTQSGIILSSIREPKTEISA